MKLRFTFSILLLSICTYAQQATSNVTEKHLSVDADTLVGIDNFGSVFFTKNNVFYKKNKDTTISYNNLQLGKLTSAHIFNPLKINLFYKDLNTVIILDNRLAEIFRVDFNAAIDYKNVSYVSSGFDNTIWLFNQDTQILEVFDYKKRKTIAQTLRPINDPILSITSNYNYCYVLTTKALLVYNYFGSSVAKVTNDGFEAITENNEALILKKENKLFHLNLDTKTTRPIETNGILISQFFAINQTLYIYDGKSLQKLQILTK